MAIINMQDGSGYFQPDLKDEGDCLALHFFVLAEIARINSTRRKLAGPQKMLEKIGA